MNEDYAFRLDDGRNTCLHLACKNRDVDTKRRYEVVESIIDHVGPCLLHEENIYDETALHALLIYNSKENIDLGEVIERSIVAKTQVVERDPKEQGDRKILNFGHTIGHALERYFGYGKSWRHSLHQH